MCILLISKINRILVWRHFRFQVNHLSSARPELHVQLNGVEISSLLCIDPRMNTIQSSSSYKLRRTLESAHIYPNKNLTPKKPFPCPICGKCFGRLDHVRRHKLLHFSEKLYQCGVCPERFSRPENRERHMAIHTQVRKQNNCFGSSIFLMCIL